MCDSIHEDGKCCGECDRPAIRMPASSECEACNVEHPESFMEDNWNGSGWKICRSCVTDIPEFVDEFITQRDKELSTKIEYIKKLETQRDNYKYIANKAVKEEYPMFVSLEIENNYIISE